MATLLVRYLMDEGANLVAADSGPNSQDLTLTIDPGDGAWYASGSVAQIPGTSLRIFGFDDRDVKGQSATAPSLWQSKTQITYVYAGYAILGDSGYTRIVHMAASGSNGDCNLMCSSNGIGTRWNFDGSQGGYYQFSLSVGGQTGGNVLAGYHVYVMTYDSTAAAGSRARLWVDNEEQSISNVHTEGPEAGNPLAANLSTHDLVFMNNDIVNKATQGYHCYMEAWDGLLTAQEITDATDALLLDCDTAWDAGGGTSVSFTQEPTSTAITETSVTAQATAESDAVDDRPPLLAQYLINEGSGTTIADSSGNGHDMTLTDTGNGGWSSIATGTTIYSGTVFSNNVKAQSDSLAASFAGKSKLTLVLVIDSLVGDDSVMRMVGTGTSGDGSYLTLGARSAHLEMRWHGQPSWNATDTLQYRVGNFSSVGGMTAHMVVIVDIDITRGLTDKIRWYLNDNLVASDSVGSDGGTPLSSQPSYVATLLNRGNADRAMGGHIGYIEWWDGLLTDEQKTAAYTALIADCDTAW